MAKPKSEDMQPSLLTMFFTYFGYAMLIVIGHIRDFVGNIFGSYSGQRGRQKTEKGYAPMLMDFENFYTRRLYRRIEDCWNRPIASVPGVYVDVMERVSLDNNETLETTGNLIHCLNLASYNYLGFAEGPKGITYEPCVESVHRYGSGLGTSMAQLGYTEVHRELELLTAEFVGKPAALIMGMGFAMNACALPALVGKGDCIISDSLNHASLVTGSKGSGAKVEVFNHNDSSGLEARLRRVISDGQPLSHRPWRRVVVLVEGIYSMEGQICDLPEIVRICKKYKVYLYVDEAHSIGALGRTGRGVCEYHGVDPADIDILMGTFTKSFGSCGGYVAASQDIIDRIRAESVGIYHDHAMSVPACVQAITSIRCIMGLDGSDEGQRRLVQLHQNTLYFRKRLAEMGFDVIGSPDSPVVPMMLYIPGKMSQFGRECLARGLAVVVVAFPATPILLGRARFCLSAGHTREDMDFALGIIDELGERLGIKYHRPMSLPPLYELG